MAEAYVGQGSNVILGQQRAFWQAQMLIECVRTWSCMFCSVASWETKSLSSGGTSTCLVAVSILNATDSENLFENERSL